MKASYVAGVGETPFPVALLRPRVGIKQIDAGQGSIWQPVEQQGCIFPEQANVGQLFIGNGTHRLGHAVDERLAADEPEFGMQFGAVDKMLAAAKADFQHISLRNPVMGFKQRVQRFGAGRTKVDFQLGIERFERLATLQQVEAAYERVFAAYDARCKIAWIDGDRSVEAVEADVIQAVQAMLSNP